MTSEWAITKRIRVSASLSCDLTVGPGGMVAEWLPDRPRRPFTKKEIKAYREGRNALLQELATRLGGTVALIEI